MEIFMPFLQWIRPGLLLDHPENLWYAIPGMVLVVGCWLAGYRWRLRSFRQYGDETLVARYSTTPRMKNEWVLCALMCGAVLFGSIAATLPYVPAAAVAVPSGSLQVVAVFDASISMSAEDYRTELTAFGGKDCTTVAGPCGTRMDAAKQVLLNQIMPAIQGNQLGLVVYSGYGTVKSYLNDDFSPLVTVLGDWKWIDVGSAQGAGSFIESGLDSALKVLDHELKEGQQPPSGRTILLFTDGGHDGKPEDMAKELAQLQKEGVRLIIIGVGSTQDAMIPTYDSDNNSTGYYGGSKPLTTSRDDAYLSELAAQSGGEYLKVTPGEKLSINWPSLLAGTKVVVQKDLLYQYPLGLAMLLLAVVFFRQVPYRFYKLLKRD